MRNPFLPKDNDFIRIEEPEAEHGDVEPAVVFPGRREPAFAPATAGSAGERAFDPPAGGGSAARATAAPADADAALRAALATLQRISGTA